MSILNEDQELLEEFRTEASELLEETEEHFNALDANPEDISPVNPIFRAFHTIKGNSAFFGLNRIKRFAHSVEAVLDDARNGSLQLNRDIIDGLFQARDHLLSLILATADDEEIAPDRDEEHLTRLAGATALSPAEVLRTLAGSFDTLNDHLKDVELEDQAALEAQLSQIGRLLGAAQDSEPESTPPDETDKTAGGQAQTSKEPGAAARSPAAQRRSMRVDEKKIDQFMDNVGELMNMVEIYTNLLRNMEKGQDRAQLSKDLKLANRNFHEIADSLQHDVMEIRQVPIRGVLNKLTRIVKDLARSQQKDVAVKVTGEDQLIDKSYVEVLEGPLVHMVRNAVDHGIESTAEREAAGKPVQGTVRIRYVIGKDNYEVILEDDGKGMDADKLRKRVVEKGLLKPQDVATLSDEDALQLIFLPGFSTAEQVTDVSGRGVGMDVVMNAVTNAGGSVRVESKLGEGSTIRIELPRSLTLVVVNGLLVDVASTNYIIPMENLRETIDLKEDMVISLPGDSEVVTVRDKPLSLVRLAQVMKKQAKDGPKQAVVVAHKRHAAVLEVDQALGLQKVVVKQMEDTLLTSPYVRGGAVLGDGSVGLVLDVSALV